MSNGRPVISEPVWDFVIGVGFGIILAGVLGSDVTGLWIAGLFGGFIGGALGGVAEFRRRQRTKRPDAP